MKALVCEKCGGPLKLKPDTSIAVCDFCGTEYYLGADEKEIEKRLEAERKEAEKRAKEEKEAKIRRKCNQLYELKRQGYNESIRAQKQMDKLYDEYSDDSVFLWEYVSFYTDRFKNESFLMLYKSHWSALKQNAEEAIEMAEGEEKERRRKEWEEYRQKNEDAAEAWEREKAEKASKENAGVLKPKESTENNSASGSEEKPAAGAAPGKNKRKKHRWLLVICGIIIFYLAASVLSEPAEDKKTNDSTEETSTVYATAPVIISAENEGDDRKGSTVENTDTSAAHSEPETEEGWRIESLNGRGRSDRGRNEPNYINGIGYVVTHYKQNNAIEKTDQFQDTDLWKVPTYKRDKQFWVESGSLPHKTEVIVREQILKHDGHGWYSGYLRVEKTDDGNTYYIKVENFVTKPYWTYQTDLPEAASTGILIARYKQVSNFYPVDSGGGKLEIPDGTIVLVTGITGTSSRFDKDETGIEAIVWKEWRLGYGGVKCHFNEKDLTIIY